MLARRYSIVLDAARHAALSISPAGGLDGGAIVDLRRAADVERARLKGSINLPAAVWFESRAELPPRGVGGEFYVLFDGNDAASLTAALDVQSRFTEVLGIVDHASIDAACGWLESGPYPPSAQPRLWRPGPVCETLVSHAREWLTPLEPPGHGCLTVLDVGAGMGRNSIYLAQELPRALELSPASVRVTALDNRAIMGVLVESFGRRAGAAASITTVTADFRKWHHAQAQQHRLQHTVQHTASSLEPAPFDVVLMARFLDKEALRSIDALLPRGRPGLLVIEHFHASGGEGVLNRKGRALELDQTLREGEALELVTSGDRRCSWTVLMERRSTAEDGRPLLQCVLRFSSTAAADVVASH